MAKKSLKQTKAAKARAEEQESVKATRAERAQAAGDEANEASEPARSARQIRNDALQQAVVEDRMKAIDLQQKADEEADEPEVYELTAKPGSGAGLKPGDYFAPSSNPGAAARVPMQPLQPESKQSHGKGIVYDKDLDNPPYGTGDPVEIDAGPSGSSPYLVDKEAEAEKAEKMTARGKQLDPDNPTLGHHGADATASPLPIGTRSRSKNSIAGGSNSGID